LQKEDESEKKKMEGGGAGCSVLNEYDDNVATILIFQQLLGERQLFDRNTLVMKPGSVYPSMKEFSLVTRQYIIDKEFELDIEATEKTRYRGYCRDEDCLWSINVTTHITKSLITFLRLLINQ
jgi:hypothetical protein